MSNPYSSESIPNAILVPKAPRQRKKLSWGGPDWPWMKIAIGGCIAWLAIIFVVALYFATRPDTQRLDDQPIAELPPMPAPLALPKEAVPKEEKPGPVVDPAVPVLPEAADPLDEFDVAAFKGEFVDCAKIGTQVKFMKDPAEAFKRARDEKKLVFMMHLSGNLEDPEFT